MTSSLDPVEHALYPPPSRLAVQVPEHSSPCQVPEPASAERCPRPEARFSPLLKTTLMMPVSATRPDALNMPPVEATCPLSMAMLKLAPLGQFGRFEEICTFQCPS